MATITAAQVNELRRKTGVGMMDCKRALVACNGDLEAAIEHLRKTGIAKAEKKAGRSATQGIFTTLIEGNTGAIVELLCETDFVAKTENFQNFVNSVAVAALHDVANLTDNLKDRLSDLVSSTGENLKIGRAVCFELAGTGKIGAYIHMGGKVGVLVEVTCGQEATLAHESFTTLVHDLSLHIAAAAPRYLNACEVEAETVASEKALYRQQMEGENKPENVIEKIIEGKIRKFYSETCLVDQPFVKEPKQSIKQLVEATAKSIGDTITIKRFARFQVGA